VQDLAQIPAGFTLTVLTLPIHKRSDLRLSRLVQRRCQ
jgi:hypothetical protein